MGLQKK
jgi:hypothetical protein